MDLKNRTLFFGDNLDILREHIPDNSIDLIYLDPPFNSNSTYNLLFAEPTGERSKAQIRAFDDTWYWTEETELVLQEISNHAAPNVIEMLFAFRRFIKKNDMLAYIVMMTTRLLELHRVLKQEGSIYLHCDPTASHYLKIMMDTIFGPKNYQNEIIWQRVYSHNDSKRYGKIHDVILFYTKSENFYWNSIYTPYSENYLTMYSHDDGDGRKYKVENTLGPGGRGSLYEWNGIRKVWRYSKETMQKLHDEGLLYYTKTGFPKKKVYLDEMPGKPLQDIWTDINLIAGQAREYKGYPTQKPRALLERIIKVSCPRNGIILDPFCGCGTTISATEYLNHTEKYKVTWIGIDITHLAINLIKGRLNDEYKMKANKDYMIDGEPKDVEGARMLAQSDRFQFQWWTLSLINASPYDNKRKGADSGIDGLIFFVDEEDPDSYQKIIVQVKSGKVQVRDVRDLKGVVERESARIGVLLTLEEPSQPMKLEAVKAGFYKRDIPKIQILTVRDILEDDKSIRVPLQIELRKRGAYIKQEAQTVPLFK